MKLKLLFLLLIFVPIGLLAQGQITGTVSTQDDGMPLPGASVIVVGTTNGTITDFDGNYTLENVSSDATLAFSYIGFLKVEIPVNGQSLINASLSEDAQLLQEVVVTGYATERKADLTGAVTVVELGPVVGQRRSNGNKQPYSYSRGDYLG